MSTIAIIQTILSLASSALLYRTAYRRGQLRGTIDRRAVEASQR